MKAKHICSFLASFLFSFLCRAQNAPDIAWQQTFGTAGNEQAYAIEKTNDGGFIVGGLSATGNGYIVKENNLLGVNWQFTYQGVVNTIHQNVDGTYIVAGYTTDASIQGYRGATDFWVAKLNANGGVIWQRAMGGSQIDIANSVTAVKRTDGQFDGYILAGYTQSSDGDIGTVTSGKDVWIVKIDMSGNISWYEKLSGDKEDVGNDIIQTTDYSYVVTGYSSSAAGTFTLNQGGFDAFAVKLDIIGNIIWKKNIGGSADDLIKSVKQTQDGGYIMTGNTRSNDGDVRGNHGNSDLWVVKLKPVGSIEWEKQYGGLGYDIGYSIKQSSEGGYIVAGATESTNGDVLGNHGSSDYWVLKIRAKGEIEWQKPIGGSLSDVGTAVDITGANGFLVAGYSFSSDKDISGNHGGGDFWVVKLNDFVIIDPVIADMVDDQHIINKDSKYFIKTGLTQLDLQKNNDTAAVTDGISKVLLVTESNQFPVTFSIVGSNNGTLSSLSDQSTQRPDAITTNTPDPADPSTWRLGVIYTPPDGYGEDNPIGGRRITIKATVGSTNSPTTYKTFTLVTPPVVMVHGMWSSPNVWKDGGFESYLTKQGFANIQLADYENDNFRTFDPNNPESFPARDAITKSINDAISLYYSKNIAVSQVDIIGHSLGGLQTRAFTQSYSKFKNKGNYNSGSIHKLITLGTPHLGTEWGPVLYYGKDVVAILAIGTGTAPSYLVVSTLLSKVIGKIGSCHRDFEPNFKNTKVGLDNLSETSGFKVHAIASRWDYPGQTIQKVPTESLDKILSGIKSPFGTLLRDDQHDMIVPSYSQLGGLSSVTNSGLYNNTEHSKILSHIPFVNIETQTTNPDIQAKVAVLLTSNKSQDFETSFKAPNALATPFDMGVQPSKQENKIKHGVLNEFVHAILKLTSPSITTKFKNDGTDSLTLSYTFSNLAILGNAVFMVSNIGLVEAPTTPPYTTTVALPASIPSGRLSVAILANDTNGVIYADTLSVQIVGNDVLLSLTAAPATISLDSTYRATNLHVNGLFQVNATSVTRDVSNTQTGTVYTTKHAGTIVKIDAAGYVSAQKMGTDTITATYGSQSIKIPVTVDGNFASATFYANTINFPAIPDQPLDAAPFALDATASSGDAVQFTLVSGPATLQNGVVIVTGKGTVTVQATCGSNPYFSAAAPVTRSFNVNEPLPLQLIAFTGALINNSVLLNWATANEQNTSYFMVERSTDGTSFTNIGTVKAAGNSTETANYYFKDPSIGTIATSPIYYRLREFDKDGMQTLSNIVPISLGNAKAVAIYPNPSKGVINLLFNKPLEANSYLKMYDMAGRQVMDKPLTGQQSQQVQLPTLSNGNYKAAVWANGKLLHQQTLFVAK